MRRRTCLAGVVGVLGSLSGCSGIPGSDSDGDGPGPPAVAASFLEALFAGNVDRAATYVHADSDLDGTLASFVTYFRQYDTRLEETSVVERDNDGASVDAVTRE